MPIAGDSLVVDYAHLLEAFINRQLFWLPNERYRMTQDETEELSRIMQRMERELRDSRPTKLCHCGHNDADDYRCTCGDKK
jgi:hypothetical protein